jgi:predicted helicase
VLKSYFQRVFEVSRRGDAREESYYSALEELINNFKKSGHKKHIYITILPKKTEAGNPDFRIWDGEQSIVGYIEAKRPEEDLNSIENTEQLKRYRKTFPNLILTNFYEFKLYRNGDLLDRISFLKSSASTPNDLKAAYSAEKDKEFNIFLDKFFAYSLPNTYTAKSLAVELAKRTRFLRDQVIANELKDEENKGAKSINGFYKAFQEYLIPGLKENEFIDLYAQTITYGLFIARTRSQGRFNRKLAFDSIPRTIGVLRDLFKYISLGDLSPQMEWIVDDISDVLAASDVNQILHEFYHEGKGKDPVIPFYETFLTEYDPEEKKKKGVFYTPEPMVSYIVRSLNILLKEKFSKKDGFADNSVTVLDPCAGTLTFMAEASKLAVKEFVSKYGEGGKKDLIKNHILENFYAFEIMMAPYALGHLKTSFLLEELGYKLKGDDRFKLYLTNTLEMKDLEQTVLPGIVSLFEESHLAEAVKKKAPILVILGNPPYLGHSANNGDWISKEIREYYTVDGKPLNERNPKWLQDDYVKFIRFAQWKIDQIGEGVLGFITNHSYLDNPTFRGMRQSLMRSFNEIYLLDLHGNSLKKEKCPNGSKDENVFGIRSGVAIALFIKKKQNKGTRILHAEQWGLRENKYKWLIENDIRTTEWKELNPHSEFYLFVPRDETQLKQYEKYPKITDIFQLNSVGIATARDNLTIQNTPQNVWKTIQDFSVLPEQIARSKYNLGKDSQEWKVSFAQNDLRNSGSKKELIAPVLYRPFDIRYTYYTGHSRGFICRPRYEVMKHMRRENLGIIVSRSVRGVPWRDIQVTNTMIEFGVMATRPGNSAPLFPLYLYTDFDKKKVLNPKDSRTKKPNLNQELIKYISKIYGKGITPEEILYYIYGVLYSNTYRTKYAEFLKMDFPRVPFTRDYELFKEICKIGNRLVDLHLLNPDVLDKLITKFQGKGDNRIDNQKYDEIEGRVYINKIQFFEGIKKEVWEYYIGGYQVLDKWLKDRKEQELSLEDIKHYCSMATAIQKTIELQKVIDQLYPELEREIIKSPFQKGRLDSLVYIIPETPTISGILPPSRTPVGTSRSQISFSKPIKSPSLKHEK